MTADPALRILHVSEVHWGGVVTLLEHFVREQDALGHDVHVLAPPLPALSPGVTVHPWRLDRSAGRSLIPALREFRACVATVRPHVVHLHSYVAGMFGRLPLGLSGIHEATVVYQPHAWSDRVSARPGAATTVRASERMFARRTDLVVANCEDELSRGRAFGVTLPGRAIGVAVDLREFRPPTILERARARESLGLDPHRQVVLVLGRMARQKGQDLLVRAWRAAGPVDATLALVGPGDPAFIAPLAGDEVGRSIILPGGTDDVLPWLWAADVLALSSRYETVALVVAEAMSTGLPVVATAVDGAAEVLHRGPGDPAGTTVALGDCASLVRELQRRLADPELRSRESAAGPVRARELFAADKLARRLEDAYREAIGRQESGRR